MSIVNDIIGNVSKSDTAKDLGVGVLGAVIGSITTNYILGKREEEEEYDYDEY